MLCPALAIYLFLLIGPALYGLYASFSRWRGPGDSPHMTGLANYRRLFHDSEFHTAFFNTLKVTVFSGAAIFVLAFAFTMVMREMKGRTIARSIMFVPYIVSPIVIGIALGIFLAPAGALNTGLSKLGLNGLAVLWLNPDNLFKTIMIGIVWVTTGFYITLLTTGMDRIPAYYYEAADLAGANTFQKFRYVSLPMTWDIVSVAAVLWVINSIRIFDFIYAFVGTASTPPISARTIPVEQFLTTTGGQAPPYEMGYGCAMGVAMVLLILVLVVLVRRAMRRDAIEF
jgi:raffinose/stachyose/melibiose transport system permease protein